MDEKRTTSLGLSRLRLYFINGSIVIQTQINTGNPIAARLSPAYL